MPPQIPENLDTLSVSQLNELSAAIRTWAVGVLRFAPLPYRESTTVTYRLDVVRGPAPRGWRATPARRAALGGTGQTKDS